MHHWVVPVFDPPPEHVEFLCWPGAVRRHSALAQSGEDGFDVGSDIVIGMCAGGREVVGEFSTASREPHSRYELKASGTPRR